jgi:hypothetical protein
MWLSARGISAFGRFAIRADFVCISGVRSTSNPDGVADETQSVPLRLTTPHSAKNTSVDRSGCCFLSRLRFVVLDLRLRIRPQPQLVSPMVVIELVIVEPVDIVV